MNRTFIVTTARTAVWVMVGGICLLPIVGWLFLAVSSIGDGQPSPVGPGPEAGLIAQMMGSMVLVGLFFYACWCAAWIVCGFGVDRMVCIAAYVIGEMFPTLVPILAPARPANRLLEDKAEVKTRAGSAPVGQPGFTPANLQAPD